MFNRFIEKTLSFGHRYGITVPAVKDHGLYKKSGPLKELVYPGCEPYYYEIHDTLEDNLCGYMLILFGEYTWVPPDCFTLMHSIIKFLLDKEIQTIEFGHLRVYHMEEIVNGDIRCKRTSRYACKIDFITTLCKL